MMPLSVDNSPVRAEPSVAKIRNVPASSPVVKPSILVVSAVVRFVWEANVLKIFSVAPGDSFLYIMYMNVPESPDPAVLGTGDDPLSVAQAREQFPSLLEAAEGGTETVIARRGRPVAVLGPLSLRRTRKAVTLDSLIGTGSKLWGSHVGQWVDHQRGEWD